MPMRPALFAAIAVAATAAAHPPRLAAPATGAPARYVAALRRLHLPPGARLVLAKPHGPFDVALVDPTTLVQGCADGTLAHLDWQKLGGQARFAPAAASDCGAGAYITSLALAWPAAKSPRPLTWADVWNVAQMPGRRALPATPVGTLEIALLADGVAPGDVYAALASNDGLTRAFHKLDQLRPYIVWWHSDTEALRILASGGARMAAAPAALIAAARPAGTYALQPAGALSTIESFALAKTAPATAITLIAAATAPATAAALAHATGLTAPTPDNAPRIAAGLTTDGNFWHAHGADLQKRFTAWLAH